MEKRIYSMHEPLPYEIERTQRRHDRIIILGTLAVAAAMSVISGLTEHIGSFLLL
jgi:hypothetical protein